MAASRELGVSLLRNVPDGGGGSPTTSAAASVRAALLVDFIGMGSADAQQPLVLLTLAATWPFCSLICQCSYIVTSPLLCLGQLRACFTLDVAVTGFSQ
jgi:hypothetical protein